MLIRLWTACAIVWTTGGVMCALPSAQAAPAPPSTGRVEHRMTPATAVGACCLEPAVCYLMTEAECLEQGGVYMGDGTTCDPDPCTGTPEGACCLDPQTCYLMTQAECAANGGIYLGDGTTCDSDPCLELVTFRVNTTNDTFDGVCDGTDCSLKDAIYAAEQQPGYNIVVLQSCATYRISTPYSAFLEIGLPKITDRTLISGNGAVNVAGSQGIYLFEVLKHLCGLRLVDRADRKTYVHQNVITDPRFGHIGEVDLPDDSAEINLAAAQDGIRPLDTEDFSWNSQTHLLMLPIRTSRNQGRIVPSERFCRFLSAISYQLSAFSFESVISFFQPTASRSDTSVCPNLS